MNESFPVGFDASLHTREPEGVEETLTWVTLDSAFNFLRIQAVKYVLADIRRQAGEQGVPFPAADEEVFAGMTDRSGKSQGYETLAIGGIHAALAASYLYEAFEEIVRQTAEAAKVGIEMHQLRNATPEDFA